MAHWIIEDHGFGGQVYKCSKCGRLWNDLFRDISMEENCPKCGSYINENDNVYLNDLVKRSSFHTKYLNTAVIDGLKNVRVYEEMENKLIQVSGYDIEKLIELFAAGYTLKPPKYESVNDSLKRFV